MGTIKRSSLTVNAMSNMVTLGVNVIVGIFLTPFIISRIGQMGFGSWTLIGSIVSYYGLLDLGISSAVTRYVAYYASKKDFRSLNDVANTALMVFSLVGLFVIAISYFWAPMLARFFNVPAYQVAEFKNVLFFMGIAVGLGFPANIFNLVIRAHEHFLAANLAAVLATLLRTFLMVLFLMCGWGMIGLSYAILAAAIFGFIFNMVMSKILLSHYSAHFEPIRWDTLRTLLSYGVVTTVIMIANTLRFDVDNLVIGKFVGISEIAVFSIAASLIKYCGLFINSGVEVIFPRLAALDGKDQKVEFRRMFLRSVSAISIVAFGISAMFIIFGEKIIIIWVGENYLGAAPILSLLIVGYAIAIAQTSGVTALLALERHRFFSLINIFEGVANLGLSIYLAPRYGIMGVAIGTFIPMMVVKLFIQPPHVCKVIGVSLFSYWKQIVPPLALAAVMIFASRFFHYVEFFNNRYISLIINIMPLTVAFAILYLIRIKTNNEGKII